MIWDGVQGVQPSTQFISLSPAADFVAMDVNDIVHTVAECSRPYLSKRKTVLTIEMCDKLPRVWGNQERLTEVLNALLLRAEGSIALAARTSGMIRIRTSAMDGQVRVSLLDNGFGPCTRDTVLPDQCPSLTKCAEIISDHGGRLYSWRPYASGASYTIILPVI